MLNIFSFVVDVFMGGSTRKELRGGGAWDKPPDILKTPFENQTFEKKSLYTYPVKYCEYRIRKQPETLCNNPFYFINEYPEEAAKVYCELHRRCFWPKPNGTRCGNMRMNKITKYCSQHYQFEGGCHNMVSVYEKVCGEKGVKALKNRMCDKKSSKEINMNNLQLNTDCYDTRLEYEDQCIHKSVRSAGHIAHMDNLQKNIHKCSEILNV